MFQDNNSRYEAAIEYERHGLKTIPLRVWDKRPAFKPAYEQPIATEEKLKEYYLEKNYNIGVVCGFASGWLFVIDIDDKGVTKKCRSQINELMKLNPPVVETRRGCHIYFKCPDIVGRSFEKQEKIDFKKKGHVVAPPSIIPYGQEYQGSLFEYSFTDRFGDIPKISWEDIPYKSKEVENIDKEFIRTESGILIPKGERPHGIPLNYYRILLGDKWKYASRSDAEQALVVYLIRSGWAAGMIYDLFEKNAKEGTKYKDKGKDRQTYLKHNYDNAFGYLASNRRRIDKHLDKVTQWAENNNNWKGRGASTDQAVFLAFLQIARRTGKVSDISASCREIAEATGLDQRTASRVLDRIPFLKHFENNKIDDFKSTVWEFNIPKRLLSNATKSPTPTQYLGDSKGILLRHDVFREKGIGKNGFRILMTGLDFKEWRSLSEIVDLTNINRRTIERKIPKMEAAGLIEIHGQLYNRLFRRIENADLDKAAEILGTAGTLKKQKEQHEREREAFEIVKENRLLTDQYEKESLIAG